MSNRKEKFTHININNSYIQLQQITLVFCYIREGKKTKEKAKKKLCPNKGLYTPIALVNKIEDIHGNG
jgi:hypothetical protein